MGYWNNDLDAAGPLQAGEWVLLCFWLDVDGKSRRIFINGQEAAQDAGKAGIEYKGTKGDTVIGSWGTRQQYFNGIIDEVQVWNRALSEDEILQSMENLMDTLAVDASSKFSTTWAAVRSLQHF